MPRREILICGFGGQGVIFAGELLGRAGIRAGLETGQSASYGSEARGSACHAGVVLSSEPIGYPKVRRPDVVIAMSQAAYDRFASTVKPGGRVIFDSHLVKRGEIDDVEQIGVPAASLATRLGRKGVANVVMLTAAMEITGDVSMDALREALGEQSPEKYREMNLKAFDEGMAAAKAATE